MKKLKSKLWRDFFFWSFLSPLFWLLVFQRLPEISPKTTCDVYFFSPHTAVTDLLVAAAHYSVSLIVLSLAAIKRQFNAALNSRNCKREQFRGFFLRSDDQLNQTSTRHNVLTCARYIFRLEHMYLRYRKK